MIYRNIKTKELYQVVFGCVINTTNGKLMHGLYVVYTNRKGTPFIRERVEFYSKFKRTDLKDF